MNDDPFLDLFALDLPDLTSCAPDLSLAVELYLARDFRAAALALARPVAGGAPAWWDDAWDFIGSIWGGVGDMYEKIGKTLDAIWDRIWGWIGGTVRWLHNRVVDVWDWLKQRATDTYWTLYDILHRLVHQIPDTLGSIWDWLKTTAEETWWTLYDILHRLVHQIPDTLGSIWDFIRIDIPAAVSGAASGIGDAITRAFRDFVEMVQKGLDLLRDALVDAIKWPWEHIMEPFGNIVEDKLAIPRRLIHGQYTSLLDFFDDMADPPIPIFVGIVGAIILGLVIAMITTAITTILVAPLCLPHTQDIQEGVGRELLTIGVVQEALNRGFIDERTADFHLSKAGYSGQAKTALLELRNVLPGPTDLVRMAVREVFDPAARTALSLDAEFPEAFAQYAALLGIQREWAENHWAAHWDLPSPSQGYEMLHRGLITEQELAALLKALDYAPVWRDKLQAISYSPITRVDLRRLYKAEVITEDDVFAGYKALGYNDERARWLTDWTKSYYGPDEESELDGMADLAASAFRTAYRRGVLSRAEALDKIIDAGYTEDVADFLLAIDDAQLALNPTTDAGVAVRDLTVPIIRSAYAEKLWDRARAQSELEVLGYLSWEADLLLQLEDLATQRELADLAETVVKAQYVARAIDRTAASKQLDQLKVLPERRDLLLQRWDLQGAQKTRELTVAQLQRGLRDGLLPEVEVLSRFSGMGYNEADAKFLVDDVDKTPEGKARRLSVSQLSQAYKIGAITDAQLLNGLLGLGYSQEDAQVLVDIATPAPEAKARQLSAGQLSTGFRAGLLTEAELLDGLIALGYAQTDAELLRDIAAQKPEPTARKLSVAQLKELFKAATIDKAGLLVELLDLGYTDRDAGWIADLIAPEE